MPFDLWNISLPIFGYSNKLLFVSVITDWTCCSLKLVLQQGRPWSKLNTSPVCFGAAGNHYGSFKIPSGGHQQLIKLKLVHLYGYVTCDNAGAGFYSYSNPEYVLVAITNAGNEVLLPPSQLRTSVNSELFLVPGYTFQTPELVLSCSRIPSRSDWPTVPPLVHWGLAGLYRIQQWWKSLLWCLRSVYLAERILLPSCLQFCFVVVEKRQ